MKTLNKQTWYYLILFSLLWGFLHIPIHEFGHAAGSWITGTPAYFSYAREIIPPGYKQSALSVAGGPLINLIISLIILIHLWRGGDPFIWFTLLFNMTMGRILQYAPRFSHIMAGNYPGFDETKLGVMMGIEPLWIYLILTALFLLVTLGTVLYLRRFSWKINLILVSTAVVLTAAMTLFGIFIVEKHLFPDQFQIQFG